MGIGVEWVRSHAATALLAALLLASIGVPLLIPRNISAPYSLPPVTTLPPLRDEITHTVQASTRNGTRLLVIPSFTSFAGLGFNNVRYTIEISIALGLVLERRVVIPRFFHMQRCANETLCRMSPCELRRDEYWCPLELFLKPDLLEAAGAVFDGDTPWRSRTVAHAAFDVIYESDSTWFDQMPPELRNHVRNHRFVLQRGQANVTFPFYKYFVGCELSYIWPQTRTWTSTGLYDVDRSVGGVLDEIGDIDAEVMVMEGRAMYVTRFPVFYIHEADRDRFDRIWREHTSVYQDEIVSFAEAVVQLVQARSEHGSFVGVHMRRGNFVELGLLKGAEELSVVKEYIADHRLSAAEPFYLATNEQNPAVLNALRRMGAVLWSDVMKMPEVPSLLDRLPTLRIMVGFEDYVGLIEQMVCTHARLFIGTRCSSLTGQILNLRYKHYGDRNFYHFPHRMSDDERDGQDV